jgi:hypothetical protein
MSTDPNIIRQLDSCEVYDPEDGQLDGYALRDTYSRRRVTPVRCCRTCAWADAQHVVWRARVGLYHEAPAKEMRA